jgi:hypothetical protein
MLTSKCSARETAIADMASICCYKIFYSRKRMEPDYGPLVHPWKLNVFTTFHWRLMSLIRYLWMLTDHSEQNIL